MLERHNLTFLVRTTELRGLFVEIHHQQALFRWKTIEDNQETSFFFFFFEETKEY